MLNRTQAPSFKQVEKVTIINAVRHELKNKLPVHVISGGEQELVKIEFVFGNVNWDASKPLLASTVNNMLIDGTSTLTGAEISSKIDFYGAFIQTEYNYDTSSVILYSLNKHLNDVLPIVKEVLTDAIFPDREIETYIINQQQKLKVSLEKNDFLARKKFNHILFGETLYGADIEPEDFSNLKREDIIGYFKKVYHPKNCTIVIAGNVLAETIIQLNNLFGEWKSEEAFTPNKFDFKPENQKHHYIERKDALQSAIRIGYLSLNRNHPDFPAMQVLNTILGGYFGSRLMANIREDKGYTYGIGSANPSLQQAGYFFIASEVGKDVCNKAIEEIKKEVEKLRTELVPDEELELVKNYLMGSLLGSLENTFSHADKFKNIHFYGLGYDYYDKYISTIKKITPAELLKIANTYWNWDNFYQVIVG